MIILNQKNIVYILIYFFNTLCIGYTINFSNNVIEII